MEWIYWLLVDIPPFIWAFGLSTNGSLRNKIIILGGSGTIITIVVSIALSVINKNLDFIGVVFELIVTLFVFMIVLGFIFRNIPKRPLDEKTDEEFIRDFLDEIKKSGGKRKD